MNFEEVKELITMIDNSKLAYFEIENKDGYIKIDKSISRNYVSNKIDNSEINNLNKTIKITPKVPKILINNILIRLIGIKKLNFIPIQLKLYINNEVTINLNVIFFNN